MRGHAWVKHIKIWLHFKDLKIHITKKLVFLSRLFLKYWNGRRICVKFCLGDTISEQNFSGAFPWFVFLKKENTGTECESFGAAGGGAAGSDWKRVNTGATLILNRLPTLLRLIANFIIFLRKIQTQTLNFQKSKTLDASSLRQNFCGPIFVAVFEF